jgi:hypothetical protein
MFIRPFVHPLISRFVSPRAVMFCAQLAVLFPTYRPPFFTNIILHPKYAAVQ